METDAELIALKNEVAELRKQLTELSRFLHVEESEETGKKILTLCCSSIFLYNAAHPDQMQGMLTAREDGISLALWGSDQKARIIIEVQKDRGNIRVYQQDLKVGVDIGENEKKETIVGVLHEGKPRAVLKGLPETGCVSAVYDEGLVRATMLSKPLHGEMLLVGGDLQSAVKLSSEGHDGGGFLTVNHANGKAAVILASTPLTGFVILNDSRGKIFARLPAAPPPEPPDNTGED